MNWIDRWRERNVKIWKRAERAGSPGVVLVDRSPELCEAWARAFTSCPSVTVCEGDALALGCDALVSPGNSFGDMSGGLDAAIDAFHGGEASRCVRAEIGRAYCGELPVGAAIVTQPGEGRLRFLVTAPTMRVPGEVRGSINAYLAMRAALVAVLRHNESNADPIASLAVPGLGTGVGRIDEATAALHMLAAYESVLGGGWRRVVHPAQAPFALGRAR